MKLSFVGDIMLGRFVAKKFDHQPYKIVSPKLVKELKKSDYIIANLESPIMYSEIENNHSMVFQGNPHVLKEFKWVDCFSLSNNHINDCGKVGMKETIESLNTCEIDHNGLYKEKYTPYLIETSDSKIAIITCTDMMNKEFDEDSEWKTIRINDDILDDTIDKYKAKGYFVIMYAHVGMLFTRYPNPPIRSFLHEKIDNGVDLIFTVHSHVLGGMEIYKDKYIFHSLGDFVMDGSSFRRRNSGVIRIDIQNNRLVSWDLICATTNINLSTDLSTDLDSIKMIKSFDEVTNNIRKHSKEYTKFYKKQYKKELIQHSISTIKFIFKTKGLKGLFRIFLNRFTDILGMAKRVVTDRSKMRYDSDAINHNSKQTIEDII
jgi:poly-gamma-glutamate capsule biosynthesis protein CapA/YwtB (metallophosphatase superfamily)